ncbi:hypothetical protein EJB05_22044, partial [Eragrostis curvula]
MAYSSSNQRIDGTARRSSSPVRQLLKRLWRRGTARPRRAAPVSFGYDLHSYSQNFDDGLGSSGHRFFA